MHQPRSDRDDPTKLQWFSLEGVTTSRSVLFSVPRLGNRSAVNVWTSELALCTAPSAVGISRYDSFTKTDSSWCDCHNSSLNRRYFPVLVTSTTSLHNCWYICSRVNKNEKKSVKKNGKRVFLQTVYWRYGPDNQQLKFQRNPCMVQRYSLIFLGYNFVATKAAKRIVKLDILDVKDLAHSVQTFRQALLFTSNASTTISEIRYFWIFAIFSSAWLHVCQQSSWCETCVCPSFVFVRPSSVLRLSLNPCADFFQILVAVFPGPYTSTQFEEKHVFRFFTDFFFFFVFVNMGP